MLNILPLPGGDIEPVLEDGRIRKISFTGSDEIGWELMKKFSKKKVTLELGGNAATVIDEDPPDVAFARRGTRGRVLPGGAELHFRPEDVHPRKAFDKGFY